VRQVRKKIGPLAQCFMAWLEEDGDPVDREAAVIWLTETFWIWRRRMTEKR
jgi:hypothetical protein